MKNKNFVLMLGMVFLMGIVFVNFINAELNLSNPEYIKVLNEFKQGKEWVSVTITLIDLGDNSLNINSQLKIISNFSKQEFELSHVSSNGRWFEGNITTEGLDKLENNFNILMVYLPILGSSTDIICGNGICNNEENCNTCSIDCGQCKKITFISNPLLWIIIPLSILFAILIIFYLIKQKKIKR